MEKWVELPNGDCEAMFKQRYQLLKDQCQQDIGDAVGKVLPQDILDRLGSNEICVEEVCENAPTWQINTSYAFNVTIKNLNQIFNAQKHEFELAAKLRAQYDAQVETYAKDKDCSREEAVEALEKAFHAERTAEALQPAREDKRKANKEKSEKRIKERIKEAVDQARNEQQQNHEAELAAEKAKGAEGKTAAVTLVATQAQLEELQGHHAALRESHASLMGNLNTVKGFLMANPSPAAANNILRQIGVAETDLIPPIYVGRAVSVGAASVGGSPVEGRASPAGFLGNQSVG